MAAVMLSTAVLIVVSNSTVSMTMVTTSMHRGVAVRVGGRGIHSGISVGFNFFWNSCVRREMLLAMALVGARSSVSLHTLSAHEFLQHVNDAGWVVHVIVSILMVN